MTQALAITRMTMRSMLRVRRFLLLGSIELVPALIYLLAANRLTDLRALELAVDMSLGFYVALWFPIVSLIISSWALGNERRDATLSFLVLRPISRYSIAASKLVAAVAAAVLINSIGAVAMAGGYAIITGSWSLLAPLVVGGAIISIGYVAIFLPLGYLTQWAVFIGLGFVLIFENGIASALSGVATLSPWRIGYSALAALLPPEATVEGLGNVAPGVGGAVVKAVVLVVLSIVVLGTLFKTRDLT
jgi:ABC-2 type transport system permease protein